jgi:hypothetical protein
MASFDNLKVSISEYENIAEVYKEVHDNIEDYTNEFFTKLNEICNFAIEGKTKDNLKLYASDVHKVLKGNLGCILLNVESAIIGHSVGFRDTIEQTDVFK